jgi:hypothetical protein
MHDRNTYLQQLRSAYLYCHPNCLISTNIFWRIVLSLCKMIASHARYRIVKEVYKEHKYIELFYFYVGSTYFYVKNDNLHLTEFSY